MKPSAATSRNVRSSDNSKAARDTDPAPPEASDETNGRSLRRGLMVLDAVLKGGHEGVRVIDLCRQCDLPRAPVYRLLATLVDCGYVVQRGRFRYVAGPSVALFTPSKNDSALAASLQPVLARISAACGDAAFAVLRDGGLSHCIARQIGSYPVQILTVQVGKRQPLGVGAAGLAVLAALPPNEAEAVIKGNSIALGSFGGMTPSRLGLLVRATRERGWAAVGNHAAPGAMGVGMAVRGRDNTPVAGISVAASIGRMPKERQQLIAGIIREAVATLLPNGL